MITWFKFGEWYPHVQPEELTLHLTIWWIVMDISCHRFKWPLKGKKKPFVM